MPHIVHRTIRFPRLNGRRATQIRLHNRECRDRQSIRHGASRSLLAAKNCARPARTNEHSPFIPLIFNCGSPPFCPQTSQPVQQEWARSSDDRARCRSFHCTWQAVEEHTQRDPQVWRAYLRLEVSSYLLFALGALRYSPRMSLDWVSTPPTCHSCLRVTASIVSLSHWNQMIYVKQVIV